MDGLHYVKWSFVSVLTTMLKKVMQGGKSKAVVSNLVLSSTSVTIVQLIAVNLHVYNCLVIIIEYRLALHAMTLMGVQHPLKHF